MALKIIRNNIVNMCTDAIVNTANPKPIVGSGCDSAIYETAGYDKLLDFRKKNIGEVDEGNSFVTPAFDLKAMYIIHTVSPMYKDGSFGEEEKLRNCYRSSLLMAAEYGCKSISFPVVSTGSFGYPKEEGMNIAVEEINDFLASHDMDVYLVVFDDDNTEIGRRIYPGLEEKINSLEAKIEHERNVELWYSKREKRGSIRKPLRNSIAAKPMYSAEKASFLLCGDSEAAEQKKSAELEQEKSTELEQEWFDFEEVHGEKLNLCLKSGVNKGREYAVVGHDPC